MDFVKNNGFGLLYVSNGEFVTFLLDNPSYCKSFLIFFRVEQIVKFDDFLIFHITLFGVFWSLF